MSAPRLFRPSRSRSRRVLRAILVAAVLAGAGFFVAGAFTPPPAHAAAGKARVSDYFTAEDLSRSRRYTNPRYAMGFASLALGLAVAGFLGVGAPARAIGAWAARISGGRMLATTAVLAAIVTLTPAVVTLPLSLARGLYHERAWGLSTQTLGGFLSDQAKAAGFQIVVVTLVAAGFFFLAGRLPSRWPPAAAAFLIAVTVLMVVAYPLVYEPLFNKFRPVDQGTRERIVALAGDAGVRVGHVLVADASRRTTRQNAYVSGLGATKRVVLYDTLLEKSTPDEVDLIVAHELGHVVHKDVWRGTLLACAGAAGAVLLVWLLVSSSRVPALTGASGASDPRLLPFVSFVLAVATLVTLPLANGFSRSIEASADRFAVRTTGQSQTAVRVEVNLARDNIADLTPNGFIRWMFFTHPAVMERIRIALEAGETNGSRP